MHEPHRRLHAIDQGEQTRISQTLLAPSLGLVLAILR